MSRRQIPLLLGIFLFAGCEGLEFGDDSDPEETKFSPDLSSSLSRGFATDVIVVFEDGTTVPNPNLTERAPRLRSTAAALSADARSLKQRALGQLGGDVPTVVTDFPHLPAMHMRLSDTSMLSRLAALPDVQYIFADEAHYAFAPGDTNLTQIRQDVAAASSYLGAGTAVAVLDTGLDYTREPFNCAAPGSPAECPVAAAEDIAPDDGQPDTGPLHGTNVAAIVVAVAPQAKVIGLDVFDGGAALTSSILKGLDWIVAHQADYNIVAVNLSLGTGINTSPCAVNAFEPAFTQLRSAGVLPVVASGNDASRKGIANPACSPQVISVGAVYPPNTGAIRTSLCKDTSSPADKVACFSNSASFLTLLAPGVGITASGLSMSGTSQAAPHVAGAIAVLAAAFPDDTLATRTTRLRMSKTIVTDGRNKVKTPRLDLQYAVGIGEGEPAPLATLSINEGDAFTTTPLATLQLPVTIGTPTEMCISTTSKCSTFVPYSETADVNLPGKDGKKTIYVKLRNAAGKVSAPTSSVIILDTLPPAMGRVTTSISKGVISWKWSGSKDAGTGIQTYTLMGSTEETPIDCESGTPLYTGNLTSWKSPVQPPKTTWFVRVCATDKAGHTSTGITGRAVVPGK